METLASIANSLLRIVTGAYGAYTKGRNPDLAIWVGGGITGRSGTSGAPASGYDSFIVSATNASQSSILINRHELWAWKSQRHRFFGRNPRVIQLSYSEGAHLLKPFSDPWTVTYRCENLADVSISHPILEVVLSDSLRNRRFKKRLPLVLDNRRFNAKLLKPPPGSGVVAVEPHFEQGALSSDGTRVEAKHGHERGLPKSDY